MKIREILSSQKYDKYVVTDIGNFPHCLPGYNSAGATKEEKFANLTAPAKVAYDKYEKWRKDTRPARMSMQFSNAATSKTFVNHYNRSHNDSRKEAECSNFAYHAIGLLIKKGVTKDYNICLAGVMDDYHNIAILLPKGVELSEADKKAGLLPMGSLIVDPWAVGMGLPESNALAIPAQDYAYSSSLPNMVIHYQTDNDVTLVQEVHNTPVSPVATPPASPIASPRDPQPVTPPLSPVENRNDSAHLKLLKDAKFDTHLARLMEKANYLTDKGYPAAAAIATTLHSNLTKAKNDFIKSPFTPESRDQFAKNCASFIDEAKNSELGSFRGASKLFMNLVKALVIVITFGQVKVATDSVNKIQDFKQSLSDAVPDKENVAPTPGRGG